jgi:hypothetical protein
MIECCNLLHTQLFNYAFEIGGWSKNGKKVFSKADIGFNCTVIENYSSRDTIPLTSIL